MRSPRFADSFAFSSPETDVRFVESIGLIALVRIGEQVLASAKERCLTFNVGMIRWPLRSSLRSFQYGYTAFATLSSAVGAGIHVGMV